MAAAIQEVATSLELDAAAPRSLLPVVAAATVQTLAVEAVRAKPLPTF